MNRGTRHRHALRAFAALAPLALATTLPAASALAASMTVRVTDAAGQPVADVAVVVSSPGKPGRTVAAAPVEIVQQGMRFVPAMVVVTPGTRLRLTNRDRFDHHVRGSQGQSFEYRIAGTDASGKPAGDPPEVVLQGGAGPILLGCYLHSRMQASIYVADSPWYGVTNAEGQVKLDDVPDGPVQVAVWHAQQIVPQPALQAQQLAAGASVTAVLNFTPRQRR